MEVLRYPHVGSVLVGVAIPADSSGAGFLNCMFRLRYI